MPVTVVQPFGRLVPKSVTVRARAGEAARARHSRKERTRLPFYRSAFGGGVVVEDFGFELADDADGLEHGGGVALGELEVGLVLTTLGED
jgi:hypothetical protein